MKFQGLKYFWITLGWFALFLGFVGLFLPILPTTPFLLVAAFAFSKGSKKLYRWLLSRPIFGDLIRDWRTHRSVPTQAKIVAVLTMGVSGVFIYRNEIIPMPVRFLVIATLVVIAAYVGTRPSAPK